MTLYLVRDGDRDLYVALEREDRFYVYDPHTGRFHQSAAVWREFYGEHALTYQPVDLEQARELVAAGVGGYDGRALGDLLRRRQEDPNPLQLEDVFGEDQAAAVATPSARKRSTSLAAALASGSGWVTWQTYPKDKLPTARVAASNLRLGKIAAVRNLGQPVEAEVRHVTPDRIEVRVRRSSAETPPSGR